MQHRKRANRKTIKHGVRAIEFPGKGRAPCLEDAGHDGAVGEVAGELGLVGRDALDAHRALSWHVLENFVDEEEWVTVGKDLAYVSVHEHLQYFLSPYLFPHKRDCETETQQ